MNIAELERELEYFGFTKREAAIYLVILQNPDITGYQVSKILNLTKSTAYAALNSLFERGAVFLIPGDTNRYQAKDPKEYFAALSKEFSERAETIVEHLDKLDVSVSSVQFQYITGYSNTLQKIREVIDAAQQEICISTHMDLHVVEKELEAARKRGVRLIVYTGDNFDYSDFEFDFEYFKNPLFTGEGRGDRGLTMVADFAATMIAYGSKTQEFSGTYSENRYFTQTLASYINLELVSLRVSQEHQEVNMETLAPDTLFMKWFESENVE